ncbi:MAG: CsgG/HfaB family protein [candidate division KSB1 bacterium]|jgi:curli biogenesis system outer membrane secretion channel CsgG|nr:CsgG/HfaB family protein [candidate division KSB1 bacterium]
MLKLPFRNILLFTIFLLLNCTAYTELRKKEIIRGPEFMPYDGLKTTVAVMDFANESLYGSDRIGSAVADMLVTMLMRSGRFIVLERQLIQEILQEQALGQSGIITEETAPDVGSLLGVQTLITGTITEADEETGSHIFRDEDEDEEEEKEDKGFWGLALKATVGHIEISFRMTDTSTGTTILSDRVSATEVRPGIGFKNSDYEIEDSFEFDQTILALATRKAINSMIRKIVGVAEELEWRGKVVEVANDSLVYFTPGRNSGIVIGDWFEVWGQHQATDFEGELYDEHIRKGSLEIIDFIGEKISKTVILDGGFMQTGDIVVPLDR